MDAPALPADLSAVFSHLESTYPNEGCGLILREASGGWRVRPMENAYDRYRARDPERFPRTARTAYFFDPKEMLAVFQESDARGDRVACIFHSHCDVGAYFSAEDRAMAAPEGEPLFPDVSYLVIAVDQGRSTAAKLFWWAGGEFREIQLPLGL